MKPLNWFAIFTFLQGLVIIGVGAWYQCDAIEYLQKTLISLGTLILISSILHLFCEFTLYVGNYTVKCVVNTLFLGITCLFVYLCLLTWPENDRLWDGGKDCDGVMFAFVYLYTVISVVEFCLMCICMSIYHMSHSILQRETIVEPNILL